MNDQEPEVRLTLLATPSSVILARKLVKYALTNWGCHPALIHDSMVVMSEIVTNAVAAAQGRHIRLRCALKDRAPLLECWDPSPAVPTASDASLDAEQGRGMFIIGAYAKDSGVRPSATTQGKVIWALMPS